jgi:hypothetical protein
MTTSPFKFLDPYGKDDAAFFFGREKETAQLFNAVHASNLTLLYGASGTGKTSLINCGLANKFYDTDWLPLFIRRGKNINEAIETVLNKALVATEENPERWPVEKKVDLLFLDYFKPIYLIFDQFEELFIFGTKAEQEQFYLTLKKLLDTQGLHVKVIISIREEWIAYLNEFEKVIPYLFDNRLRVERMSYDNLCHVIEGTLTHAKIDIEPLDETIDLILKNIHDKKTGIELTNLQVYLDRVYRKAVASVSPEPAKLVASDLSEPVPADSSAETTYKHIVFTPSVVNQVGAMDNVISDFLDEEMYHIEIRLSQERNIKQPKGLPMEILFALVSNDGTKKPSLIEEIVKNLPENKLMKVEDIAFCLEEFKRIRILRETD